MCDNPPTGIKLYLGTPVSDGYQGSGY